MPRQPLSVDRSLSTACTQNEGQKRPRPIVKMADRAAQSVSNTQFSASILTTSTLERMSEEWLLDCEYRLHSPRTLETRRIFLKNLHWFLQNRSYQSCGTRELREFFHYLMHGHEDGGRWGRKHLNKPVRPNTVKDYWICLNSFFKWLVAEGSLPVSPMEKIPKPTVRFEEKQPLSVDQIKALIGATRRSQQPRRNEAIFLLLLDTGIRSSELVSLKIGDIDLRSRQCSVLGKGNKVRVVYFGMTTGNALRLYLRQRGADAEGPLFLADKSRGLERSLTRSGLQQLLERLGQAAGLNGRSCSPHVLRRTFAMTWLRNGATLGGVRKSV